MKKKSTLLLCAIGIILVAYLIAWEQPYRLSQLALLVLPASFYAVNNKLFGKEYKKRSIALIVLASVLFYFAQFQLDRMRVLLWLLSALSVGIACFRLKESKGKRMAGIVTFIMTAFILPVLCIGYVPYLETNERLVCRYLEYDYSPHGLFLIKDRDGEYGIRDRYGMILSTSYENIRILVSSKPYVKVRRAGLWGVYDLEARKMVVEPCYTSIEQIGEYTFRLYEEEEMPEYKYMVLPSIYYKGKEARLAKELDEEEDSRTVIEEAKDKLAPGERIVNENEDLTAYFWSLCMDEGAQIWLHHAEEEDSLHVWDVVEKLNEYACGRGLLYPKDEVRNTLEEMSIEQGYIEGHSAETDYMKEPEWNPGEIFMFRFLDQAARYCPKLAYLTDICAPNGEVGVLNYGSWCSDHPLYSFLLYRTSEGFKVEMIGKKAFTFIDEIYQIEEEGETYYLCVGDNNFDAFLYRRVGQRMELLCSIDRLPWEHDSDAKVIFNIDKLEWIYCKQLNGDYVCRMGDKRLFLILDGKKSTFRFE